ncbi:MAG: substrate-binding domain-containing protein [Thermoleophilia bacterium]|nr:substrate-binding domain-containing protein [Thermoleophilia bacterium]
MASVLILAGGVAACGDSGDSDSGGDGGTIGVSVPTVEGPFFTAMLYGINDEAEKLGISVDTMDAGGYENVDQQVDQFQSLIVKQPDSILVDPADPTTIEASVDQAMSAGIDVIGSGDPAPNATANVSSSHCEIGKAMAVGAKKLLPDGGTLAMLTGPAGATWTSDRLKCFKESIDGSGIEIVAEKSSDPAVEQGVTIATDFLQRYPDLDLIYGADDTVGVGAAQAVKAADRCGKTQVLTAVLGRQVEQQMKAGCVQYIVAQQTVKIGRVAVQTAQKLADGETLPETEVAIPLIPVTPDNVDSVDVSTMREPDNYTP